MNTKTFGRCFSICLNRYHTARLVYPAPLLREAYQQLSAFVIITRFIFCGNTDESTKVVMDLAVDCEISLVAEWLLPKQQTRVRFSYFASISNFPIFARPQYERIYRVLYLMNGRIFEKIR